MAVRGLADVVVCVEHAALADVRLVVCASMQQRHARTPVSFQKGESEATVLKGWP